MKTKYYFFVLVNNKSIYDKNCYSSIENLIKSNDSDIILNATLNFNNEYSSIRSWINEVLYNIYCNKESFVNSWVFFTHQDTYFPSNFVRLFERKVSSINFDHLGLFGFAGIDNEGNNHKYILDSGSFSFSYDLDPVVVDSVDEFVFGINTSAFIEHKIFLSKLAGWHAYGAEFSIILQQLGYSTYFFPVFTEHNSIRSNNSKIAHTHHELFKLYGINKYTLVGKIMYKSIYEICLLNMYSLYVNYFKYGFFQKILEILKINIMGRFSFYNNNELILNNLITKKTKTKIFAVCNRNDCEEEQIFKIRDTTVCFKIISNIQDVSIDKDSTIIVLGLNSRINGFNFNVREKINFKLN